ncbi:unnamed protein product [Clavelina lepadiformis]|uniref:Hexosyltransferase n=2 Tax=Clavelina lepadiformis TaxID=159417 RepID=A0ABP0F8J7_CLALP
MERWHLRLTLLVFTMLNAGIFVTMYQASNVSIARFGSIANHQRSLVYNYLPKEIKTTAGTTDGDKACQTLKNKTSFLIQPWRLASKYCEKAACLKDKKVNWTMVFFVKSAAPNQVRRELLRRTWASLSYVEGGRFETVFVIGKTDVPKYVSLLQEESERYGDLLQFNDFDDYEHIGLKTLAGMQWASDNLPSDFLYSSVDDDFMVNLGKLQKRVDESINDVNDFQLPMFPIICGFKKGINEKPVRQQGRKWSVSLDTYIWPDYPQYCHGGLYTTSIEVVKKLFNISRKERTFHLDDVWITGILRNKLGMSDSMLVKSEYETGIHYSGYHGKARPSVRDFMKEEWENIFKLFNTTKTFCKCLK